MEIKNLIDHFREIYSHLIDFIENEENGILNYKEFKEYLLNLHFENNKEEFKEFLQIIVKIIDDHSRQSNFYCNIEQIFLSLSSLIKETLTNLEIFNLFKNCRRVLLLLIQNDIINIDKSIVRLMIQSNSGLQDQRYVSYFFPEIKKYLKKDTVARFERELRIIDKNIFDDFEGKRLKGENEAYICSLIRNDSVEEFVTYISRSNISISSTIKKSIFESNTFLIKNDPTLIEYAAFFGSIQIMKYLAYNGCELNPSLWIYAIHGRSPDVIHYLNEVKVIPKDETFTECFEEAIKCHQNNFAEYIENNLLNKEDNENNVNYFGIQYHNYNYFPANLDNQSLFFLSCQYNYLYIVKFLLKNESIDLNAKRNVIYKEMIEYYDEDEAMLLSELNDLFDEEILRYTLKVFI
ncbi:hypothetical protein M9Y10_041886 [Tritrichomonas musculus]|uniref:DUF3447 domain-containing protein n=1 Tax=Tritrichomonas musculus TaxID=1915356 RepID=A0ABR2K6D2_9EUKA